MEAFHIDKNRLEQMPAAVKERIDEVGLREPLENLLDHLNSDYPDDVRDQEFLHDLLDWIIRVLSDAIEPLPIQTFMNLNSYLHNLRNYVIHQDWNNIRNAVPDILRELSTMPTARPTYEIDKVRELTRALSEARRQVRASDTRLRTVRDELQQEIDNAIREKSEETTERFEHVLGAAQRSMQEALDEIDALKTRANDYLDEIREVNQLSADAEVGGGHFNTSGEERRRADIWRWIAIGAWGIAAVVAASLIRLQIDVKPDEWEWSQWALRTPLGLSLVGIIAAIGKYASSQSAGHRAAEWSLRNRGLALRQIRLAIHDLSADETRVSTAAQELLKQVAPALYTDKPPDGKDRLARPQMNVNKTGVSSRCREVPSWRRSYR